MSALKEQVSFDQQYIGSVEICQMLDISRVVFCHWRKKGKLPDPIIVPGTNTFLWLRSQALPIILQWKEEREFRRGAANG